MGLFVPKQDDERNSIAAESRAFAQTTYHFADSHVKACEGNLERAEEGNDETTFKGGSAIAKAYEKLDNAEQVRDTALTKLRWEIREEWKRPIPTDTKLTKQLLAQIDWKNIRRP